MRVGRGNTQNLADFFRAELLELTQAERVAERLRQLGDAIVQGAPELPVLERAGRVDRPLARPRFPRAAPVEGFGDQAVDGSLILAGYLSPPASNVIDDLAAQDPDQPRPLRRPLRERLAPAQGRQQRLLHQLLGQLAIANPRHGVSKQSVPVPIQPESRIAPARLRRWLLRGHEDKPARATAVSYSSRAALSTVRSRR